MPPVEILEELSHLYVLTINDILSGRKLTTEEYKEMAESNIKETLNASTFDIKEKQEFFKNSFGFSLVFLVCKYKNSCV